MVYLNLLPAIYVAMPRHGISHKAAKATYQQHTQHLKAKTKKSVLSQTFEHRFHIIQHMFWKYDLPNILDLDLCLKESIQNHHERLLASSVAQHSA